MRRSFAIARKDFADILRERSILLTILVQLFVAAFSSFLMVGLVAFYDPSAADVQTRSRVAYVGPGGFDDFLKSTPVISVRNTSMQDALERFRTGRLDLIVEETATGNESARTITLLVPESELKTTLLVTQMKSLLQAYEKQLRQEREARLDQSLIYIDAPAQGSPYFAFTYSILLPLLVATPVFLAGSITADSLTQELTTKTLEVLRSTSTSARQILVGKLLVPVLLCPLQVLLWILLLQANGIAIHNVIPLLTFTTVLAALIASGTSLVALLVRREGPTQAAYTLLVLFLFVVSLLLPQDPFNLVARLAVGTAEGPSYLAILFYAATAVALLGATVWVAERRLRLTTE